jgi:uncharacterized protein YbjT (DUF2867 family)
MAQIKATKRVLVIGAYGLIGFGITQRLLLDGHHVIGLGRNTVTAQQVLPQLAWTIKDVSQMADAQSWATILANVDCAVNCSGALQDGPDDTLEALHHHAVAALATACKTANVNLIQISAVGAALDVDLPFLSSKARGDAAIVASGAAYHIFRPGLVLAPSAYGGTAMLRMLAAVPIVQPLALGDAQVQTVSLHDVANTVSAAVNGTIPAGITADIVEDTAHSLKDVIAAMRAWLGFQPARFTVSLPTVLVTTSSKVADALSHLGWRSPLRSTAIAVLNDGVRGDPNDALPPITPLQTTLANMPARAEDRLFSRMLLLMPLIVASLVIFWAASGIIGLIKINTAAQTLENVGWSYGLAATSVAFWAIVDLCIAAALLVRKTAKIACWAAVCVSLFYLCASTIFVPSLWVDPLGPLVKIIPSIVLAIVARISLETR